MLSTQTSIRGRVIHCEKSSLTQVRLFATDCAVCSAGTLRLFSRFTVDEEHFIDYVSAKSLKQSLSLLPIGSLLVIRELKLILLQTADSPRIRTAAKCVNSRAEFGRD